MELLMQTKKIEKRFGRLPVLQGVDMDIPTGKIIGLLGPNSSGKTTLLKTIAGLLQPSGGSIDYPGGAKRGPEAKKSISFLPEQLSFPNWMRVKDAFQYYRDVYPDFSDDRAEMLSQLLELPPHFTRKIKKLSKGMQERMALALTLSRETEVYLLDEPLGGIDPVGKAKVLDALLAMELKNSTIMIATHLVKDVERILDSVCFLSKGSIVYQGECEDIRETEGKTVEQKYMEVFIYEGTV